MKIVRSSKCNLKYATNVKRDILEAVRFEYAIAVNYFIKEFWDKEVQKKDLLKTILNKYKDTWFSERMKKVAAREAVDMISSAKATAIATGKPAVMPVHYGKRMCLTSNVVSIQAPKNDNSFSDYWLHIHSIGKNVRFDIPVRVHDQFLKLLSEGTLCTSVTILENQMVFSFNIDTGPKQVGKTAVGIDTGIKALATLSTGEKLGTDIESCISRVNRCKHGSKGQLRASRALRQRIDEVARDVSTKAPVVVVEDLKSITIGTKSKRSLDKNMRRVVSRWNVSYWMMRLKQRCEWNRVSFRSVAAYNTSRQCSSCGHTDKKNRLTQERFCCTKCGHIADADINAAQNILTRFITGPYGAGYKPLANQVSSFD